MDHADHVCGLRQLRPFCGADVDFVYIDPATGLMSVAALEQKLQQPKHHGTVTKVVAPVHLTGSSCDFSATGHLAQHYSFVIM